jgi:hypothetical protein
MFDIVEESLKVFTAESVNQRVLSNESNEAPEMNKV